MLLFLRFPVVSLADSLNHRLMGWQASGLHGSAPGFRLGFVSE
jgi:hypothetical protein